MLTDNFFTEYEKTGNAPQVEGAGPIEKDSYTKAEVDKLINDRIGEVIAEMRKSQVQEMQEKQEPETPPEEHEEETE